jgi:putative hemolysin
MILANILLLFFLIALNGFFVAMEFAVVAARRARLDILPKSDGYAGRIVRGWLESPPARDRILAATQLGITIISLALGAVGENTFELLLAPYFAQVRLPAELSFLSGLIGVLPLVLSLVVVTALHVVLGEQTPKIAVLRAPEKFILAAAPLMRAFSAAFKGFIDLLDWATHQLLSLLGLPQGSAHGSPYTLEELREMVSGPEMQGIFEEPEREMLSAVMDFGDLVVRQVSIPRTEMVAIEADEPLEEAVHLLVENSLTKLPVYEKDLDHILGILHIQDLLIAMQEGRLSQRRVRELVREAFFVPESIPVSQLLQQFRARRVHLAIVLDEFGGTYGLVTLEDLLEEIIGEVQDPFDAEPPPIRPQPDGSVLVDGMVTIDEFNEYFGLNLSDPDYDTIAGYMLGKLGRIPSEGDTVEDDHLRLKVEKMDRLRIALISVRRI